MKKLVSLVMLFAFISGCASVSNNDENIAILSQKVDELANEISKLKQQQMKNSKTIEQAKSMTEQLAEDSQKTNQRIDNFVASYKK